MDFPTDDEKILNKKVAWSKVGPIEVYHIPEKFLVIILLQFWIMCETRPLIMHLQVPVLLAQAKGPLWTVESTKSRPLKLMGDDWAVALLNKNQMASDPINYNMNSDSTARQRIQPMIYLMIYLNGETKLIRLHLLKFIIFTFIYILFCLSLFIDHQFARKLM